MRIARFKLNNEVRYGELVGEQLHPLEGEFPALRRSGSAAPIALSAVKLLTPTLPTKVVAIGPGQRTAIPKGRSAPERPTLWFKPAPSCLTNPGDPVIFPPTATALTHEVELGIVIGKTARRVKREVAEQFIAGYTVHNDLTAGNPMKDNGTPLSYYWKSFDGLSTYGPVVVTDLKMSEVNGRQMLCRVNGALRTNVKCDLLFAPDDLVSWISHIVTLYPGDVISTGAPGIGQLVPGDVMESEIEGIGCFSNRIEASDYEGA